MLNKFNAQSTLGDWITEQPARARVLQKLGIDCHSAAAKPLDEACRARGLDPQIVIRLLLLTGYASHALDRT